MIYVFTNMENFLLPLLLLLRPPLTSQSRSPNPNLKAQILSWRLRFGLLGWDLPLSCDLDFEAEILASKLESGPPGRIWALRLGFEPRGWDLGLETEIWASKLGFKGGGYKEGGNGRENSPNV